MVPEFRYHPDPVATGSVKAEQGRLRQLPAGTRVHLRSTRVRPLRTSGQAVSLVYRRWQGGVSLQRLLLRGRSACRSRHTAGARPSAGQHPGAFHSRPTSVARTLHMRPAHAGCTPQRLEGETMPESPRARAGRYIFVIFGIAIVAGAAYYALKGVLAVRDPAPA